MRFGLLAPRTRAWIGVRVLVVCAAAGVMSGAASCGATGGGGSTVTVSGHTLSIYSAVPPGTPGGSDILDAERLALKQNGATIGKYTLRLVPVTAAKVSDNARTAIEDTSSIAYVGALPPGASADSLGITNGQDLLQVSPGDTALELTTSTPAVPGAPGDYYEAKGTYGLTFARVVPSSALEAKAQVQEMRSLGVKKLYVASDGTPYGAAFAAAVRSDAGSALAAVQGAATESSFHSSGADALFYAAAPQNAAAGVTLLTTIAESDKSVKLFVPSTFNSAALFAGVGPAKLDLYVSAPGFRAEDLPAAGRTFVDDFTGAYGHAPDPKAIFAYEAVRAILDVLREAGSKANDRSKVVDDFFAIKNRRSALGTYSIRSSGDISLGPFVFSRWQDGTLTPVRFLSIQG